jgi:transcriptional regulator with XRE-family HTH domain
MLAVPKPSQTLTLREREICARVRIIRKDIAKWSQPDLAKSAGISQNQLVGIEYGRVPLRYSLGIWLCKTFDVNQLWLGRGELPRQPFFETDPNLNPSGFNNTGLFSWAFDRFLVGDASNIAHEIIRIVGEQAYRSGQWESALLLNFPPVGSPPSRALAFLVKKLIPLRMATLSDELLGKYGMALLEADEAFRKRYRRQLLEPSSLPTLRKLQERKEEGAENVFTDVTLKSKSEAMKSEMQKLMDKVRRKASHPGAKALLARELDVAPARISEWLRGDKEPGGEYTLQLLKWVGV